MASQTENLLMRRDRSIPRGPSYVAPLFVREADRERKAPASEETKRLAKICFERGLLLITCGTFGNVIRTLMPLVITDDQIEKGFGILEEALREVQADR